jgi:ribosomal protein S27AE
MSECPECGTGVEFQSKAGDSLLGVYQVPGSVPVAIAQDLDEEVHQCDKCGYFVTLKVKPFNLICRYAEMEVE